VITRNPDYELVDIYADEAISGTNTKKRDDFNRMIADCRAGKIDLIITKWEVNIKSDDVLLRHKTRLLMKHAAADPIKEFDSALMMAVMDHITVYEDGRLQIRFFDETEFEVATE